ncbi:MAG TPA: ATP-binding protein [Roseiflexaceae bacterium]|nr:ATP-binding protein [Roseiflexaceae bacterium]
MLDPAPDGQHPLAEYRQIVATTAWLVALLTPEGRILAMSEPAQAMCGATPESSRPFEAYVAPADRPRLRQLLAQAVGWGEPALARLHLVCNSQPQQVEVELRPVLDLGVPLVTAVIYPHSLAHRRSQLILECNLLAPRLLHAPTPHEVYDQVAETLRRLGFGMLVLTLDAGGAALRLTYSASSLAFTQFLSAAGGAPDVVCPVDAPLLDEVLSGQRALYHPDALDLIQAIYPPAAVRVLHTSQRLIGLRGYIFAPLVVADVLRGVLVVWGQLLDQDDAPFIEAFAHQIGGALAQIDLRRRMEDQYAASARLYREAEATRHYLDVIIQNAPDAMLVCRPDMAVRPLNPAPLAHHGYDVATLDGQTFLRFCPPEHHDELRRRWQAVLAGEPQRFEMELLRADGGRFSALISADLIPGYGEVLVIVKDITELRRLEAHIRQSEKLSALGRLVAGAAHELNNPLAVILGLAQLQLLEELPERTREDILNIERAALRAAAIVQQLRLFARPQALRPQPVDAGAVARDALARLSAQIASHGIVTRGMFVDEPLLAAGEPHQIEQVLFNILHNAVQALAANPPGAPRDLFVRGWLEADAVRLSIADSGPGISPEHLSQIFEPFFTTRDVGQGLGLGLAIVHAIVRQHRGQVWAESTPGRGTAFELQLPAAAPAPPGQEDALVALPPGLRILIVEDEEQVRAVAERTLARLDCWVEAVGSAEEALARALVGDYAVVISDLQMPGMDGPALYERLHPVRPGLRWLILTGDTMGEHSRAFLERTALPVLPKPFTQEQLVRSVAECLS